MTPAAILPKYCILGSLLILTIAGVITSLLTSSSHRATLRTILLATNTSSYTPFTPPSTPIHHGFSTIQHKRDTWQKQQPYPPWPRPTLNSGRALWAAGWDAREKQVGSADIPTLTWDVQAADLVHQRWSEVQFPQNCTTARILYMAPFFWGITSQIRDYSDIIIVSVLTSGRNVVYMRPEFTRWCAQRKWLECFFEPLSGCQGVITQAPDVKKSGSLTALQEAHLHQQFPPRGGRAHALARDASLFPQTLWNTMLDNEWIHAWGPNRQPLDVRALEAAGGKAWYAQKLSAIRSMLLGRILRPLPKIRAAADAAIARAPASIPGKPYLAFHMRWTDKSTEGGESGAVKRSKAAAAAALDALAVTTHASPGSIFIMSDSPKAVAMLRAELADTGVPVWESGYIAQLLPNDAARASYEASGHDKIKHLLKGDDVYAFYDTVLIDALIAAKVAWYLIGVGTSGVSQLVAQWMASMEGIEGNLLTLWQEQVSLSSG